MRLQQWSLIFFSILLTVAVPAATAQYRADVQFIHNAADPALDTIDVYINGSRMIDDLTFREATPYLEVPSASELYVTVAYGTSTGPEDEIVSYPMTFQEDEQYVVVASGLLYPAEFKDNPSGESTDFRFYIQERARQRSSQPGRAQFFAMHGVPDAPAVSIMEPGLSLQNLEYGTLTGYHTIRPLVYFLRVVETNNPDAAFASVIANLRPARGMAGTLLLSGFAEPDSVTGAPPLKTLFVYPNGEVAVFPTENLYAE